MTPAAPSPAPAITAAVDPQLTVAITGTDTDWTAVFEPGDSAAAAFPEVQVTKVSRGADFAFQPRRSLPLTVL